MLAPRQLAMVAAVSALLVGCAPGLAANPQYAKGWAVNSLNNWWHVGSLPGTTSIVVRTASGFCWAALLNTRETNADTGGALDSMMWDMVKQVRSWGA